MKNEYQGVIDPNDRLAAGDIEELIGSTNLTAEQVDAINDAIDVILAVVRAAKEQQE